MVKNFQFARTPKILFRNGQVSALPGIAVNFGKRIILVTGLKSFLSSEHSDKLLNSFTDKGFYIEQIAVGEEPSPGLIDNAVAGFSDRKFDAVVAIGGGSVLDAGKALSAMMYRKESITSFLEGIGTKEHPGTKLPVIAVPTTSGTGSEATKNAVISKTGEGGFKRSLRHDNFVPDIAIIDPELTLGCPKDITAASGMDCFTQLVESFLSVNSCNYTDALALEGLKTVKSSLRRSVADGNDLKARTGMSFAALTSGICLANAGLGTVHGFASSLGGILKIPHGVICGTLMSAANLVNVRKLRETNDINGLMKYVALGKLFLDKERHTDDYYIDGFIRFLDDLTAELSLPRLGRYGLKSEDIPAVCSRTENKYNPVKLEQGNLEEILTRRL